MKIAVKAFFDSAHQLPDTKYLITKKCANLHGHTYAVCVEADSAELKGGMVVDFRGIKNIIDQLDHRFLNEIFAENEVWKDEPTTAENIARYIRGQVLRGYPFLENILVRVAEGYKGEETTNWVTTE